MMAASFFFVGATGAVPQDQGQEPYEDVDGVLDHHAPDTGHRLLAAFLRAGNRHPSLCRSPVARARVVCAVLRALRAYSGKASSADCVLVLVPSLIAERPILQFSTPAGQPSAVED